MDKLLKIPEAADLLGITSSALYLWIKNGRIKPLRLPTGKYRIPLSELNRVIAEANPPDTEFRFFTFEGGDEHEARR